MEKLFITGTIAKKGETLDGKEKVFSYEDLETFLASREEDGPFLAVIDSPGGSVDEGFKIYDLLKQSNANTLAIRANSIASVIFLAGVERTIAPDAEMIIHNAWVDPMDLEGEVLNYHTTKQLAQHFAETDAKILDVYTSISGRSKASEIFALMSVDKDLGAQKALDLGFATAIAEDEEKPKALNRKVLTYSQNFINLINQNKQEEMKTEEKLGAFEKLLKGFVKAFKLNAQNMVVTTTEGVELYVAAEGDDLVGAAAFIAEDGLPTETPAPTGSHTLSDGTIITVGEGGVITEALEPESLDKIKSEYEEEKKAMEEEKKALEEEKKELEAKVVNLSKEIESNQKAFEKLSADFLNLKNEVLGDPDANKAKPATKVDTKNMTPMERIRAKAMNKAN